MVEPMPLPNETVTTLATALVTSSKAPLLLLDDKVVVIGASTSFCNAFNLDPSTIAKPQAGRSRGGRMGRSTAQLPAPGDYCGSGRD